MMRQRGIVCGVVGVRLGLIVPFCAVLGLTGAVQAQPVLNYSVPTAAPRGQTIEVRLHGEKLNDVKALWCSFGGHLERLVPDDQAVQTATGGDEKAAVDTTVLSCRLNVPLHAPPGRGAIRVATREGVSNPLLFFIDDLPTVTATAESTQLDRAMPIKPPLAVDGSAVSRNYTYFALDIEAKQKLSFEVIASRLASQLDPVVRLLDADGRELAFADDDQSIGVDPRLVYTFEQPGRYFLSLHDVRYRGGDGFRYRLRVGDFPLVSSTFPLGARLGTVAEVSFVGPDVADVEPLQLALPRELSTSSPLTLGVKRRTGVYSGFVTLAATTLPELLEVEPNEKVEESQRFSIPCVINGRFQSARDMDHYRFAGKKGEQILFTGLTRSLGSPTDLLLRCLRADGSQLGRVDDSGDDEGRLQITLPDDGEYVLAVEDLHYRGGPEFGYRIEARRAAVEFALRYKVERLNVPRGGVAALDVECERRGYGGPIRLEPDGLPGARVIDGGTLAAGANQTRLRLRVPHGMEEGRLLRLRVRGWPEGAGSASAQLASASAALRALDPRREYPPSGLEDHVAIGITPPFADFYALSIEPDVVLYPRGGAGAKLKVTRTRLNEACEEAVALTVHGLPPGLRAVVAGIEKEEEKIRLQIPKGKDEVDLLLEGNAASLTEAATLTIDAAATFQDQPQRYVVSGIDFRLVPPLHVSPKPVPFVRGGRTAIAIRVERFGAEASVVKLSWIDLPAGMTPASPHEIAADKSEGSFSLDVALSVASGKYSGVRIIATTRVGDRDVVVRTEPFAIEVKSK